MSLRGEDDRVTCIVWDGNNDPTNVQFPPLSVYEHLRHGDLVICRNNDNNYIVVEDEDGKSTTCCSSPDGFIELDRNITYEIANPEKFYEFTPVNFIFVH